MCFKKNYIFKINIVISIFLYLTLIAGFILNEDSLGGAINDYNFHLPIALAFKENIFDTLLIYGTDHMAARNSPFFYMLYGMVLNFVKYLDLLRFINLHIILLIIFFFYKALKIKFNSINKEILFLFSLILFLSPTLRSLAIWPYPFIYATLFFIISIYFFLIFEKKINGNFKYAVLNTLSLAISAYFTPNFGIFLFFFFFKFYQKYKINKRIYLLTLLNFLLFLPALIFILEKNYYLFKYEVTDIPFLEKFNIANKIILISTIVFFHLLPFLLISINKINLSKKKLLIIIIIYFISIIFFNFTKEYNSGGGILFHLSNFLTNNNFLILVIFFFSLIYLNQIIQGSYYNYLLIILLIPYNLQFTIYHKYFDCIIIMIFLLLFNNRLKKNYFNYKNILYFYIYHAIFLSLSLTKNLIYNIKI